MSQTFKLYRLQQIDLQLDLIRLRLTEIDAALNDDAEMQQARQELTQAEARLVEARKSLHRAEDNVLAQKIKIEQTEATLYGGKVRNPKELQDLQHESTSLKRFLITLEDRQLEAMLAEEEAGQQHNATITTIQSLTARQEIQHKNLLSEKESLERDLTRMEGERQATLASIESADLSLYEQLRRQRRGVAVSKVDSKACSACGTTLNAVLLQAVRTSGQIMRCDACGRILYIG
jgi:predicted  nucleic acid-binding Zn-ribbon protein